MSKILALYTAHDKNVPDQYNVESNAKRIISLSSILSSSFCWRDWKKEIT